MNPVSPSTIDDVAGEVGYALRLPPRLRGKLKRWAKTQNRSVNGQIVAVLTAAVAQAERRGEIPPEDDEQREAAR